MEKEIKEISDYLNTTCSNNPAEIQERISVIMVYMMRTGEMLVTSFYCWNNGRYPPSGNWVLCGMGNMGSYAYLIVEAV